MEKSSNEVAEISAEYALRDVLENICQNLSLSDLINFSLVCRSWQRAALRQMSKRGPERIFITHSYNNAIKQYIISNRFHRFFDVLCDKPHVVLLFVGSPSSRPCGDCAERTILNQYKNYIQHTLVTMGVKSCMMDMRRVNLSRGILGLFLPLCRDIEIKFSTTFIIEDLLEELTPKNNQLNTTIIMFSHSNTHPPLKVLNLIADRFPQKSYTLCGGVFGQLLNNHESNDERDKARIPYIVISMTGSNLRSCSVTINFRHTMEEINGILLNLRYNIRLKSKTMGLACYSERFSNCEPMAIVKNIFPNIPFTGLCNYGHAIFGVNSIRNDNHRIFLRDIAMSVMILTYD